MTYLHLVVKRAGVALGILAWALSGLATANSNGQDDPLLLKQRADFNAARAALNNHHHKQFDRLAKRLRDYPLYPYLIYWKLNQQLSTVSADELNAFVDTNPDMSISHRLKTRWLKSLAEQSRWTEFLEHYTPRENTTLQCYAKRALLATGKTGEALTDVDQLWLVGKSQPKACDPVFDAWRSAGNLTETLAWQRVELAMNAGEAYLARYLERFLTPENAARVQRWREIHRHPQTVVDHPDLRNDNEFNRTLLLHGIRRLSYRSATQAAEAWRAVANRYAFTQQQQQTMETRIALGLARRGDDQAMSWLAALSEVDNSALHQWRIVTALRQREWGSAVYWMDNLHPNERKNNQWRYWRARSLEKLGQIDQALTIYQTLAQSRTYYGFLAADRAGMTYQFEDQPLHYGDDDLASLVDLPPLLRAREFFMLGDHLNARREWYSATSQMDDETQRRAAKIAQQWGWHDRAIITLGQSGYRDDLELRFPLAHNDTVTDHAAQFDVDPAWAFAVIRQESSFTPDARSPKGALGLMQIMPRTGKYIAEQLQAPWRNARQLLDIETNIRFGISYLSRSLHRFDQNTTLATAAYNAGDQRVKSWLPDDDRMAADLWVELVPFTETRNYLKNVLAFSVIYDRRLQRSIKPLKHRMREIKPRNPTPAAS